MHVKDFFDHLQLKTKDIILIHLSLCLLGALGCVLNFVYLFGYYLAEKVNSFIPYTEWAQLTLAFTKPVFMFAYVFELLVIFVYFLFMASTYNRVKHSDKINFNFLRDKKYIIAYLFLVFIINAGLFVKFIHIQTSLRWAILSLFWISIFLIPFYQNILNHSSPVSLSKSKVTALSLFCITIALLLFGTAMSPYFKLNLLKISNDFLWVPEQTIMDEHYIDNNQYIMQHGIGGLFSNMLLHEPNKLVLDKYNHINLDPSPDLTNFIAKDPQIANVAYFDEQTNVLFVKMPKGLNLTAKHKLCYFVNAKSCRVIQSFHPKFFYNYPSTDREFIQKNQYELSNEIIAGHYFYHQYAMLGPINELFLGKPISQIVFLYGVGNAYVLTTLLKHFTHHFDFENYTMVLYSFYPIYLSLLFLCSILIFRDVRYVTLVCVTSIMFFFFIGFELIRFAPGFNPIRHLLDLPLLMCFYFYLNSKRFDSIFLMLVYVIGLLATLASKEFGIMMLSAVTGASFFHILLSSKKYRNFIILLAGLSLTGFTNIYVAAKTSQNSMSIYSIMGVSVAPTHMMDIFTLFFAIILSYAAIFAIIYRKGKQYSPVYLILFLLFYSQWLWLYFVWYTEVGHLFATAPIWVLGFYLIWKELFSSYTIKYENHYIFLSSIVSFLVFLVASAEYFSEKSRYDQIFVDHAVHQWNFDKAHFQSTMAPEVFAEAINLIQQYSQGNAIYIISKYDDILPFLAQKYSAMPYLELSTSLVSLNEINTASKAILTAKPKYIFVDSDIELTLLGDILDPTDPVKQVIDKQWLSYGRTLVLREMKNVFAGVSSQYKLIKRGYLLSVYQHV